MTGKEMQNFREQCLGCNCILFTHVIETKINNDTCRQMKHTGTMDNGFTAHQ